MTLIINVAGGKGHMVPAANMKWDAVAMSESFYYTNICPQDTSLNNGSWKSLEDYCSKMAIKYGRIYVVCGPIVDDSSRTIGNGVCVPTLFFKVVLIKLQEHYSGAGYLFVNGHSDNQRILKTIDEVEEITKIDFFPRLPNSLESIAESQVNNNICE